MVHSKLNGLVWTAHITKAIHFRPILSGSRYDKNEISFINFHLGKKNIFFSKITNFSKISNLECCFRIDLKVDLSPRQDGHFKRNRDYKPFWSLKIIKIKFKIWSEDDGTGLSFRLHKKSLSKCSIICNLVLHHFVSSTKITLNDQNDLKWPSMTPRETSTRQIYPLWKSKLNLTKPRLLEITLFLT